MDNWKELLVFCETKRQKEIVNAIIQQGSISAAARHLDAERTVVRNISRTVKKKAAKRLYSPEHGLILGVPEGFTGKYTVQAKGKEIERTWYKGEIDKNNELYQAFLEGLQEEIKPAKKSPFTPKNTSPDLATAVIFGDPHIGMLAHAVETLGEDYDMEKCIADIKLAIDYCVECAPASEEGWFINVGDLTHSNDTKHVTPGHGHQMDMSARHNQTVRAAGAVIRYAISKMLMKFKTVRVINARGNHDKDSAFALNMFLEGIYEKEPRVEVFGNDSKFNFIEFGKNLIMINHGDGINDNRLCGVMTRIASEMWGRTAYRRAWLGHIHHKTRREHDSGVVLESFPVLSPVDAHHSDHGYGSERGVTMITLHKEFGEVNRMEPSIEMIRAFSAGK